MNELILRNMNYDFYYSGAYDFGDVYLPSYYNAETNNMLLFDTSDCDEITVESICNCTVSEGAYEHLIDILNNNKNILVCWSQVEGTTSDYTIYYDIDNELLINDETDIDVALEVNEGDRWYKFNEVRNKTRQKINF